MHSESLAIHKLAIEHYKNNDDQSLDFEIKHRDIIERFDRYPHRNTILQLEPTAEEEEFLVGVLACFIRFSAFKSGKKRKRFSPYSSCEDIYSGNCCNALSGGMIISAVGLPGSINRIRCYYSFSYTRDNHVSCFFGEVTVAI